MEFYTQNESFESYEGIQIKDRDLVYKLTESHSPFTSRKSIRRPEKFSSLSAEERFNFIKKINALQKLINEIQTSKDVEISTSGFTLEEVLEVLNVRRAMHNYSEKKQ